MDKQSLLQFYRNHTEQMLLPFWIRALDHQHGGVYNCFNNRGDRLVSKDKYTWSQGRFLWVWSKIAAMITGNRLSGQSVEFYEHARKTARFIEENAFLDNGNCAFLLTETGEKKEPVRGDGFDTSIFADCFIVLGLTEFSGLTNDSERFEDVLKLYDRIIVRLETGDFRSEPYPVPPGYRSHSFPMIMLNVAQNLTDVAEKLHHSRREALLQDSKAYMQDIMENFVQSDYRVVEMLPDNPADKSTLLYRHVNPGHTIECMWFVMQTARKTGQSDYIQKAVLAIKKAVELGWDREFGGLLRFVDMTGGEPAGDKRTTAFEELITDTWDMKLWWPHSEALYATLMGYEQTGSKIMLDLHHQFRNYVFETFPNTDQSIGEWVQIRNRKGEPLDKIAALPVKDPYHIFRNMLLSIELLEESIITKTKHN